jgi:hypothetical protein
MFHKGRDDSPAKPSLLLEAVPEIKVETILKLSMLLEAALHTIYR